jgi:hypothetical protein
MAIVERHFSLGQSPTDIVGTVTTVVDKGHDPWLDGNGQWTLSETIHNKHTSVSFLHHTYATAVGQRT